MNTQQKKMPDRKILVVHHKADNDGILSAALIANYLLTNKHNKIETWGVDYDDLNNLWKQGTDAMTEKFGKYFSVFMTDMSFNDPEAMVWLHQNIDNLYWFDHHKPIIEESKNKFDDIQGIRNTKQSALMCVYQFIYNPELKNVPEVIQMLSDYDSWQWVEKGYDKDYIMAFNTGYTFISELNINFWLDNIEDILNNKDKNLNAKALEKGNVIEQFMLQKNKKMLKECDKNWLVDGRKCVVVFQNDRTYSHMFESLKDTDIEQGVAFKRLENGQWKVGLYNINETTDFDCGEYLKEKYNGGGHKGAAGCIISEEKFVEILKNKSL